MASETECILSKFVDTKLCGATNMLEGRVDIHRDLDKLKRLACVNLMTFNKAKCKVQFSVPQHRRDVDLLDLQRRAMKMIRELEHDSYEDRQRDSWGFSAWSRKGSRETLIAAFQYLKGTYKETRGGIFTKACSYRNKEK
ncbi:rna-directed dna polymerase from mobile element jockey-like [Pitangus sulphuratus]|nr:rna-directed dna polymerase from mobile element jockey-like [Pitangus sulphuratus]